LSATLAPLTGEAQQVPKISRIGFLSATSPSDMGSDAGHFVAFRQGLRELGYVEGQNIAIESLWGGGKYDRLSGLAAELVRLKVDIIVTGGSAAVGAAKQATTAIPIGLGGGGGAR